MMNIRHLRRGERLHHFPTALQGPCSVLSLCVSDIIWDCIYLRTSCYHTVKVYSLSMAGLSSVFVESGLLRCPCMMNTCHAMHWGSFTRSIDWRLLQYRNWVLVSLGMQYHPAPWYPAAAASRHHNFSTIIFQLNSPSKIILPLANLIYASAVCGGRRCCSTKRLHH